MALHHGGNAPFQGAWLQQQADYTLTSTTNLQQLFNQVAGGGVTLPTGVYDLSGFIYIDSMSATSGNAKINILGAGSATINRWAWHVFGTDAPSPLGANTKSGSAPITSSTGAASVTAGIGTALVVSFFGIMHVSAAGTVIPSTELATAAAAVVKANSYIMFRKIGEAGQTSIGLWA